MTIVFRRTANIIFECGGGGEDTEGIEKNRNNRTVDGYTILVRTRTIKNGPANNYTRYFIVSKYRINSRTDDSHDKRVPLVGVPLRIRDKPRREFIRIRFEFLGLSVRTGDRGIGHAPGGGRETRDLFYLIPPSAREVFQPR